MAVVADATGEAVGHDDGRRAWAGRAAARALLVAPLVLFVVAGLSRRFLADDAFINFRVVDQVMAGNGPVYNVGERVEATTSTLWAVLLILADVVSPFELEWTTVVLGLALGAFGLAAGMAGAIELARLRTTARDPATSPGDPDRQSPASAGAGSAASVETRAAAVPAGVGSAASAVRLGAGGGIWLPVGALAYLGVAAAWDWATGGLETGLGLAWLGATFWSVVRLASLALPGPPGIGRRRLVATAFLVGLGVLVRPDFAVYVTGLGLPVAVAAWRRGRGRSLAAAVVSAAALPVAVQVFRMGYYGRLFPNTLYAKEGSATWWSQGLRYLDNFVGAYWLAIPVAFAGLMVAVAWRHGGGDAEARRMWRLVVGGLLASVAVHVLGIVRVGGDYMHARLLLPDWFGLLLPVFCVRLPAWRRRFRLGERPRAPSLSRPALVGGLAAFGLVAWAGAAAILARPPAGEFWAVRENTTGQVELHAAGVVDGRLQTLMFATNDHPVMADDELLLWQPQLIPGRYEDGTTPPLPTGMPGRAVVGVFPVGRTGYRLPLDLWVYDRHGLADPVVAHVRTEQRGVPGHEKALSPTWVAAQWIDPTVEVDPATFAAVPPFTRWYLSVPVTAPTDPARFEAERAVAAAALSCGRLDDLLDTAREPLTPSRFLGNMVDAVRLEGFRFPADPIAAHREVC